MERILTPLTSEIALGMAVLVGGTGHLAGFGSGLFGLARGSLAWRGRVVARFLVIGRATSGFIGQSDTCSGLRHSCTVVGPIE